MENKRFERCCRSAGYSSKHTEISNEKTGDKTPCWEDSKSCSTSYRPPYFIDELHFADPSLIWVGGGEIWFVQPPHCSIYTLGGVFRVLCSNVNFLRLRYQHKGGFTRVYLIFTVLASLLLLLQTGTLYSSSNKNFTDSETGMEFVFVEGGCYQMVWEYTIWVRIGFRLVLPAKNWLKRINNKYQ